MLIEGNLNVFLILKRVSCNLLHIICIFVVWKFVVVMRRKSFYRADYLFPKGSILIGMGSVGSLFRPYFRFNYSHSDAQADKTAIEADFGAIGDDIHRVVINFR